MTDQPPPPQPRPPGGGYPPPPPGGGLPPQPPPGGGYLAAFSGWGLSAAAYPAVVTRLRHNPEEVTRRRRSRPVIRLCQADIRRPSRAVIQAEGGYPPPAGPGYPGATERLTSARASRGHGTSSVRTLPR